MTEPEFTPGPWDAYPDDQGGVGRDAYVLVDDGASPVARVMCYTPRGLNRKPYEANAHLIAAAPELYEALRNLLSFTMFLLEDPSRGEDAKAIRDASAALAKARGET